MRRSTPLPLLPSPLLSIRWKRASGSCLSPPLLPLHLHLPPLPSLSPLLSRPLLLIAIAACAWTSSDVSTSLIPLKTTVLTERMGITSWQSIFDQRFPSEVFMKIGEKDGGRRETREVGKEGSLCTQTTLRRSMGVWITSSTATASRTRGCCPFPIWENLARLLRSAFPLLATHRTTFPLGPILSSAPNILNFFLSLLSLSLSLPNQYPL